MLYVTKFISILFISLWISSSYRQSLALPYPQKSIPIKNHTTAYLTNSEQKIILKLARTTLTNAFKKGPKTITIPLSSPRLEQKIGAFITLKKNGELRGCIGRITTNEPLYKTIEAMARAAAFEDSRFKPLKKEELANITIEITLLSNPTPIKTYKEIILGKHGIILKKIDPLTNTEIASALFLPQVAQEQGWNLITTLEHLSTKAGLNKNAWRNDCQFEVFEGFEFHE